MTKLSESPTNLSPQPNSVLANFNFLCLWAGQIFSQIADKIYLVLIIAIISERFQLPGQPISGWVSAVMVAFTIPAILFGSVAGVYVDRWLKKWVLVSSNLWRGGLVLIIPLVLWFTQDNSQWGFWSILAITFLVSTFTQFFTPAEQSAITLVVDKNQLLSANSVCTTTVMAALILGFAIGEPLLALSDRWLGSSGKEVVVGGSYAIAGLVLLLLRTGETKTNIQTHDLHIWQDIQGGLAYVRQNRLIQSALLQLISTFSIIAALTVIAVRLAEVMPEIRAEQFGFLLAMASVGMGIGAVTVGKFGIDLPRLNLAVIGSIGMAAGLVALALVCDRLVLGLGAIASIGFFAGVCVIPMQTVIQEQTSESMRGKVFGLQNNAVNIALSLPLALAGIAESYLGLATVILILSGLALTSGLLTWWLSRNPAPLTP
ncbi:MAG: MFS transporter [Pseudanabaenaceae cyanobacterium bins.68]|nr:MFS transporter [Pseudanabaenaceae cyanobacterium bins.68]